MNFFRFLIGGYLSFEDAHVVMLEWIGGLTVGFDAFDARFMTVVYIATAAYAGGITAARVAGKMRFISIVTNRRTVRWTFRGYRGSSCRSRMSRSRS